MNPFSMKTKTGLALLFCLGLYFSINAQGISGPSELCIGECGNYIIVDADGNQILEDFIWDGGDGTTSVGPSFVFCPFAPGAYFQTVSDQNGIIFAEYFVSVTESVNPEIISLSGGFCLSDSLSSCDRVCENTTVTYVTEVDNPGTVITWTVSGAENYIENGNEITVEWGDPGQGQVSVATGSPSQAPFFISCGSYLDEIDGNGAGVGIIYIDGPIGNYSIEMANGFFTSSSGNEVVYIENLSAGVYSVIVTDDLGNTSTCDMNIDNSNSTACPGFGVYIDVTQGTGPDCCDNIIEPIIVGNSSPPYAYQWSTGETSAALDGVCTGYYSLTVFDSDGCAITTTLSFIDCAQPSGCSGSNSLCVDILEVPEAAFETNPPANNGIVEICEGQTVFFNNLTNGGFNYTWDFGTGVSSSQVNAEHTYLSAGTYEAILIARNDCFCGDSTSVTIIVEEAITPEIDCAGTICPGEEITYTSNADCSTFYWNISANGTIISGGSTSDDYITVDWGAGPEGIIQLSVDGCAGDYCLQTLFESIPIIDDNAEIEGPTRVCKGAEVIYSMPSFAGTEFVWTVTSFGTITEGQGTNEITVQWANEVTPITQQITVDYESCYLGCGGSDVLDVNILNEVFIEGSIQACPDDAFTYTCRTPLGVVVAANWTVYDNAGGVIETSAGPTGDYTVNWAFGSGTFTVFAEVQNPTNFCIDNFSIFVDVVPPTDLPLSITGPLEICPGTAYAYAGVSGAGSFDYTWYVTDGASNYILNGETVNIIWGATAPYDLALTQTNLDGYACESEPINVTPSAINAVSIIGNQFLCNEDVRTYTATDFENVEYEWQITPSDAGSVISGEDTYEVEIQWHAPGTHDLQVTVCGVSETMPITVYPRPNPVPVFNSVCPGQTGPVAVTLPYAAYDWRNEFGTTISNNATPNLGTGYYEVIVTDDNGCTENETFFIGTFGQPEVTISTPDLGNFCANGGSMILYALETSSGPLDYQWFLNGSPFGTNSSSQVITEEGTYYVQVTDINGCTDVSNSLGLSCSSLPGVPVPGCTPDGFPDFEIAQGVFCNESVYTNTSVNDVANTWSWEFIDIVSGTSTFSTLENPTHTWSNAGFSLVIFRVGIQSVDPGVVCPMATFSFDTIPLVANFVFDGICTGQPVSFTDISTFIPQTNISGWSWDFGDPASGAANTSSLQDPQHIFSNAGFYNVTLTATDQSGCISVKTLTVEIVAPPLASFTIPTASCEGASVFFEATGSFTDISWDFGDPTSGDANASAIDETYHVYADPGVYTVTLTVENIYGCIESVTEQITIEPNGLAGIITANPGTEVCAGDSVILVAPIADAYEWSTTEVTQSITVLDAGSYDVTIYDALGCGYSPPSIVIDLIPLPQAEITAVEYNEYDQPTDYFYNSYETCFGDNVFLEITDNPDYTYEWPDGEVGTEVSYTDEKDNLLSIGVHVIEVEVTDVTTGCTNTMGPFIITVHPVPENIIIQSVPSMPVCENTPTTISVFNPDPTYVYIWNTGEIGTSINTFYAGTYFVRAINQFGCEGESNTLEIIAGPNVDLIPSGCHARCNPDTMCLPPILGVASFQWYLDGSPIPPPDGNDPNFVATESGEYYVEMINFDGCITISDILTLDLYDGFGSVQGTVYFDLNNNGIIDAADTLMSGIGIILQEAGVNIDTLISNQIGSISFSNILSTDYDLLVDELNLPEGMTAIISQAPASLVGCDDEEAVEFLIQFTCPDFVDSLTLYACPGEVIDFNGVDLNIGDTQTFDFVTGFGCDSTVTVTVDGLADASFTLNLSGCTGTTVDYNGTDMEPGTQMDFTYVSSGGCDSIVTVIVEELLTYSDTVNLEACTGEFVFYSGENFPAGTTDLLGLSTVGGCDSMVLVVVEELLTSAETLNLESCTGTDIIYDGVPLSPGMSMDFTFTNEAGCDSIVTVNVGELSLYNFDLELTACDGDSVEFDTEMLPPGSVTLFEYTTIDGCDSTITVTVQNEMPISTTLNVSACNGPTYPYDGEDLPIGSSTAFIYTSANGCDSTVTVNVGDSEITEEFFDLFVCTGETIEFNGNELPAGFEETFVLSNQNGCDSIIHVGVMAYPEFDYDVQTDASCWNDNTGSLTIENLSGGTAPFQYSIDGQSYQDSTTFLNVDDGSLLVSVMDANGCEETIEMEVAEITQLAFEVDVPEVPCDFSIVDLELQNISSNPGTITYLWNDGSEAAFINVDTPGIYTVEISNVCETIVEEYVVPLAADARRNYFYAPNVFSPNNDGMNDVWKVMPPDDMEVLSFELYLFDRWGNTLRRFGTVQEEWDGSFKTKDLDPGVYVYWYRATVLSCGRAVEIFDKGDVTLVK